MADVTKFSLFGQDINIKDSTARHMIDILQGQIGLNVTEYGVSNDGTDCSDALTQLLAKNGNSGLTLFFPAGTYAVSKPIRVWSNTTVLLDNSAIIMANKQSGSNMFPLFIFGEYNNTSFASVYNGVHNVRIVGGTFNGGGGSGGSTSHGGVLFALSHCKDIVIEGCDFTAIYNDHYIDVAGCANVTIRNCVFRDGYYPGTANYECINVDFASQGGFPHFGVWDNTTNDNLLIEHCTFSNIQKAIGAHGWSDSHPYHNNVRILNNNIDITSGAPISVIGLKNSILAYNIITNNRATVDAAITMKACIGCSVVSNHIDTTGTNGIMIMNANNALSEGIAIIGNIVENAGTGTGAIYLRNAKDCNVIGNTIENTECNAFAINEANNCNISNNVCMNAPNTSDNARPLYVATNATNCRYENNMVSGPVYDFEVVGAAFDGCYIKRSSGCECNATSNANIYNNFIDGRRIVSTTIGSGTTMQLNTNVEKLNNMTIVFGAASNQVATKLNAWANEAGFRPNSDGFKVYDGSAMQTVSLQSNSVTSSGGSMRYAYTEK